MALSPFSSYVSRFLVFMPLLDNLFYLLDPSHPSRPRPNATPSQSCPDPAFESQSAKACLLAQLLANTCSYLS